MLADKFPVEDGEKLKICIENTNSQFVQGMTIDITGYCEIQGKIFKEKKGVKMVFWEDAKLIDPKNIEITVFTETGFVWIQNIWESTNHMGRKSIDSGHNGAAMYYEEIPNGRRYFCNDSTPDDDFDDIIFTVQKLKQ
jgi:hypothetical protein